jgi:hypothetical protein
MWGRDASLGDKTFVAENPPYGASIDYYLKSEPKDEVTLTVTDKSGKLVRTLRDASKKAGVNRVAWNLRYEGAQPTAAERERMGELSRFAARFGFGAGPFVVPGEYTVTLKAAGRELSKTVQVAMDPRIQISAADLQAQLDAGLAIRELVNRVNAMLERIDDLTRQLGQLETELKRTAAPRPTDSGDEGAPVQADPLSAVGAALKELKEFRGRLTRPVPGLNYRQAPRLREEIQSLGGAITRVAAAPTEPQKLRLQELQAETDQAVADFGALVQRAIGGINQLLSGRPRLNLGAPIR